MVLYIFLKFLVTLGCILSSLIMRFSDFQYKLFLCIRARLWDRVGMCSQIGSEDDLSDRLLDPLDGQQLLRHCLVPLAPVEESYHSCPLLSTSRMSRDV